MLRNDPLAGCLLSLFIGVLCILFLPVLLIVLLVSALLGRPLSYRTIFRRPFPKDEDPEPEPYRNEDEEGVIDVEAVSVDKKEEHSDGTHRLS